MDAGAREALRKGCEERARELREESEEVMEPVGNDFSLDTFSTDGWRYFAACEMRGAADALGELAKLLAQHPPLPEVIDPDVALRTMGEALAGDSTEMEEPPERCVWCLTDPQVAAARHEGPHATWCPRYTVPESPPIAELPCTAMADDPDFAEWCEATETIVDSSTVGEGCSVCGLWLDGLVRCSRDDCPHDTIRREAKR